jgi:hypothetical protein
MKPNKALVLTGMSYGASCERRCAGGFSPRR